MDAFLKKIGSRVALGAMIALFAAVGFVVLRSAPADEVVQAPRAFEGTHERVVIANIGEYSILNLIAKEKGYFTKHGLDATVDEYDTGATSTAALLDGRADIAIAAETVGVNRMFMSEDVRVIAGVGEQEDFRVIARKDKGIATPEELKGKRIGVTLRTAGEFNLLRFLSLYGIAEEEVLAVDLPPLEMVAGLKEGTLDAVVIFGTHAFRLEDDLKTNAVAWSPHQGHRTSALAYAMEPFIERHPEVIERYVRALIDAQEFLEENPGEAQGLLARDFGYDDAYIAYIWPKFEFAVRLEQGLLLSMEDKARWLIESGVVNADGAPNYLDRIYFTALDRVRPDSVTIVH